jgi:hypothetical protein
LSRHLRLSVKVLGYSRRTRDTHLDLELITRGSQRSDKSWLRLKMDVLINKERGRTVNSISRANDTIGRELGASSDELAERTGWHCENDAVNMKYNGFNGDSFSSLVILFM